MIQLAERTIFHCSDAEIANDLTIVFDSVLNQAEYSKAIQELIDRQFSSEPLVKLIVFGELKWQRKCRQASV